MKTAAKYAAATLAAIMVLAGCGGSSNSASSAGSSKSSRSSSGSGQGSIGVSRTVNTSAACSATPRTGGTIVYARQTGPLGLDPFNPTNGNGDIFADTLIYQGLVMPDPKGTQSLVPAVASSYSVSPDGKTYTFHLRPGIKFSNGQPVTAQDIKFSLDTWNNPNADPVSVLASGYQDTQIVNPSTVEVHLSQPTPGIIDNMSIFNAMIVPQNLVTSQGNAFWNHPVGTGPFMVSNWVKGSSITFTRNPYYWQPGLPYVNTVKYLFAQNDNSRILDLRSGQAQIADGIPYNDINTLKAASGIQLQAAKVPYWVGLWLNHQYGPFKDLNVRKAMEYAIDRSLINKQVFAGVGTIPNSILPQLKGDAPDSKVAPYSYDVTKAKQYMSKSAYPHGFSATLQYFAGYAEYTDLALLLQQELGTIGINLKLQQDDQATETNNFNNGAYQMIFPYSEFTSDVFVPDEYAQFVGIYDGTHGFWSWWNDPTIANEITAYVHNPNPDRVQQWQKIQADFMQQTPVINILDLPFVNAHLSNVCGTYLDALGADSLQYTWLAK
jgi:peptide/nickel transport system substrate-binding protein